MSNHALDSAPRTESRSPRAAYPASRRRFLQFAAAAALAGTVTAPRPSLARQALFAPSRLHIPGIGLEAEIEQVHIIDGIMQAPDDPWKVGWYSQLAFPGQGANVVMAGHKDYWNVGPAVFWDLSALAHGDSITLSNASGTELRYAVESVSELDAGTPPSEYTEGASHETLTLITCAGTFDGASYDERLIVRAVLEG